MKYKLDDARNRMSRKVRKSRDVEIEAPPPPPPLPPLHTHTRAPHVEKAEMNFSEVPLTEGAEARLER